MTDLPAYPRVRRDGTCHTCKGPRAVPNTQQKGVGRETYQLDPFCSRRCAGIYFDKLRRRDELV